MVSGQMDFDFTDFSQFALNFNSDVPFDREQQFSFDDFVAVD